MAFTLTLDGDKIALQTYLRANNWLGEDEDIVSVEKPGEGNMNVVARIVTPAKSIIVKQARDFVQKYPDIPAPIDRIEVESKFYELVSHVDPIGNYMPELLGYDADNYVMAMEDLGEGADYLSLYQKEGNVSNELIKTATGYLSALHNYRFPESVISGFPDNLALRKLNHEHLFVYPLMNENGFDLDDIQPGLQAVAMRYKTDTQLNSQMQILGDTYLSSGSVLLHGDYYPGSWLNVNGEFKVIDPEFCFFGKPEYDLGVMIAHLKMAQATDSQINAVWKDYLQPTYFSEKLANQFIGMELIRRIIGLAQLPLELTLDEKKNLLEEARELVVNL